MKNKPTFQEEHSAAVRQVASLSIPALKILPTDSIAIATAKSQARQAIKGNTVALKDFIANAATEKLTLKTKPLTNSRATAIHQRRTRFVREYLLDHNATQAAIRSGYSEKSAKVTGSRLLTDANVRREIERKQNKIDAKHDVTVERVTLELARLAFYDPQSYWNEDGSAKPFTELDEDSRRAVAGFEMAELFTGTGEDRGLAGYVKKFKLADKGLNLERLGRHLQMFPTKVDIDINAKIHHVDDSDLATRVSELERDLGLARAIDEAGRVGIAQAGNGKASVETEDSNVLSR